MTNRPPNPVSRRTALAAPAVRSRHPGQDASRRPLLRVLGGGGPCTVVLVAIVLAVLAAQFPLSTGGSAAAGPPADARIAFLSDAQEIRDFLGFTLTTYDELMLDPQLDDVQWLTATAVLLAGWIVVEEDFAAAVAPTRYAEIRERYLLAVEPLATTAREMTGADEWFHGKPDAIALGGMNLLTLAFAVGRARPLVHDAGRLLDAALAGAGTDRAAARPEIQGTSRRSSAVSPAARRAHDPARNPRY